ncbi:MAG: LytR C-terminal domain-containing protein [Candidatus Levybacteria bacterium]|nr:LytR C-terminal domain-containing protein [Candidatus Levybacteria bacterium]
MDNNISFSKIVATPTLKSWSQAYNAGKLFAVLSLEKTEELDQDSESLNAIGKDFLEKLEQEFFTIEEKDLESIKKGFSNVFADKKEGIIVSFTAGAFIKNVLYLFALGKGKAFIKRGGEFGLLLDSSDKNDLVSSSGFLKNNDLIVLATDGFSQVISDDELNSNIANNLPSEIAESLAPTVHKAENGNISAIIVKYGSIQTGLAKEETLTPDLSLKDEKEDEKQEEKIKSPHPFAKIISQVKSNIKIPRFKFNSSKKLFLIIAIAIVGILVFSIFTAIQNQNNAKTRALFAQVYPQALKEYEEGQSLLDLNKNLARDSFLASEKILKENIDKFPAKSKEHSQIEDLSKKVKEELAEFSPVDKSGLDRSKLSITVQNGSGIEGAAGKAAKILKDAGYNVASTGNADNYNYEGVTIKVKNSESDFINLLKKDLSKDYAIKSSSSDLPSSSPTDTLIIIGK